MTTLASTAVPQVKPLARVSDTEDRPAAASLHTITISATSPTANPVRRIRRVFLPRSFIKTVRLPCHIGDLTYSVSHLGVYEFRTIERIARLASSEKNKITHKVTRLQLLSNLGKLGRTV